DLPPQLLDRVHDRPRGAEILGAAQLIVKLAEHLVPIERRKERHIPRLPAGSVILLRAEPVLLVLFGRLRIAHCSTTRFEVRLQRWIVVEFLVRRRRAPSGLAKRHFLCAAAIRTNDIVEAGIAIGGGRLFGGGSL